MESPGPPSPVERAKNMNTKQLTTKVMFATETNIHYYPNHISSAKERMIRELAEFILKEKLAVVDETPSYVQMTITLVVP